MKTEIKLRQLRDALTALVAVLARDPNCQWTSKFKTDLTECEDLIQRKHQQEDLRRLSSSITYVFQGMGSFNDYAPGKYNPDTRRYDAIPGTDDFEKIAEKVYDLAVQLIS